MRWKCWKESKTDVDKLNNIYSNKVYVNDLQQCDKRKKAIVSIAEKSTFS